MPQKTNLNVDPYFDDFDSSKNFYKVLFRPGYSVQGRELTTLQSILQNQIENFGKYAFKQGDLVIPGEVGFNTKLDYVKLSSVSEVATNVDGEIVYQKYDIKKLLGLELKGINSGVVASVVEAEYATESDADTVYVKYKTSGDDTTEKTFRQGETLEVVNGINTPLLVVGTDGSVLPTSISVTNPDTDEVTNLISPAMGYSSAVKVEEGIYFVNGFFVRSNEQLLIVDKYYNKTSAKIGFKIEETVVFPEEDNSLYDNAQGYSNYSSPGANRLKLNLSLVKYAYTQITDKNFIQLVKVKSGIVEKQIKKADYNLLEDTLARRTFDESGDYIVDDFSANVREYYQRNNNSGVYNLDELNDTVNGISEDEAKSKLIVSVGSGKAYVKGYEIVNKETKFLEADKARDTLDQDNITLKGRGLSNFKITNVYNSVPLNNEGSELTAYPDVYFHSVFNDSSIGLNGADNDYKVTSDRRGEKYSFQSNDVTFANEDIGVITVYLESHSDNSIEFDTLNDSNFKSQIGTLWFKKSGGETSSVKTTSFSIVERPEIGTGEYLELTLFGNKLDLYNSFREYDENSASKESVLYLSEAGAENGNGQFGVIRDYNSIFTPIIGISKPKNFYFEDFSTGFNSDTDKIISKGSASYNATFSYSYFNPSFFTRITLDSDIVSNTFLTGKYIVGSVSGAYGVIEGGVSGSFSSGNQLFVTTLSGKFKPGETISDEDNNTARIAVENTISHFVVTKPKTGYPVNNTTININDVNYDGSKISLGISADKLYKVSIADRNSFLEEFTNPPSVRAIVSGLTGQPTGDAEATIVPILFTDTVLQYSKDNVKSLYSVFGSGNENEFSADVDLNREKYASIKQVSSFTFSGTKGYKYVESNGFGDDASAYVRQGDLVQFTNSLGKVNRSIVQFTTSAGGTSRTRIYLDSALPENVTNSSVVSIKPVQDNSSSSTLIFPTGSKQIKTLVKDVSDSKFKYYSRRDFVVEASSSGGIITFAAQLPFGTQRFTSYTKENYIFTVLKQGSAVNVSKGDILYIDESYVDIETSTDSTSGLTSGSITLRLPDNFFGDNISSPFPTIKLTATLETSKAKPRIKTSVQNKRIVIASGGDKIIPLRGSDYDSEDTQQFSYSDAYKLKYVYVGGANPPVVDLSGKLISGEDITNRFTFDNGQRDTFYDVSRLILKPGSDAPTGQLVVAFDYFEHSQGDFCTVDSYLHEAGVGEEEIPVFNSVIYGNLSLKDVVDFRPKVDNSTAITGFQDTSLLSKSNFISFLGSGGVSSSTPAVDSNIEFTLSFSQSEYLDRIDGVFLTKKGNFIIKKGNSSLNPSKPESVNDSIPLYYLYLPAFTNSSEDVKIIPIDNRRYTMRDIGKLEKRVERLEHYTTLSVLEQQALNMQIKDNVGIDRFKLGFIVDNFEYHKVGNFSSIDYKCSIDTQQSVLRPEVREDSINIEEIYQTDDERSLYGYVNNNGIVTLPYSNLNLVSNQFATKKINPNPFVVIQYAGDGHLNPQVDTWFDDSKKPLVINDNVGLFSIFSAKEDAYTAVSSIYNNYSINWIGVNRTFYNINPLSSTAYENAISSVNIASVSSSSNITPQNYELAQGVDKKIIGDRSVLNSIQYYARPQVVKYTISRLKPKTKLFVFMEGVNIGRWINPDSKFTGIAGNSSTTFNSVVTTDDNGNASGIIIIPSGYAPVEGSRWTNDLNNLNYDVNSNQLKFPIGVKTIRFTSSSTDEDKGSVETYAEVKYYATGIIPQNPASIISTKPSYFKANEGIQYIDSNTDIEVKPNPLAQTFKVENYEGGVFATGVDLFFNTKSLNIPVRVYLTDVNIGKPSKNIVPGTECYLNPETKLKVFANGSLSLKIGETIDGFRSGASGPLLKVLDKNNSEVVASSEGIISLNNEQIYTLILSNHNGRDFFQNELLSTEYLTSENNKNSTNLTLTIAKDSGKISQLTIESTGINYDSAILSIESPQLPGGATAIATCRVDDGKIYHTDITLAGRGYTENPAIVIKGIGTGSSGAVIKSKIEIDTPAVIMGVATDDFNTFGVANSITPSRFNFKYPVYLQNNTDYALVIETDSIDYQIWASRLGESDVASNVTVTTQPALGSLYKSQNVDNWTEDLFEDIKFTLHRAEFDISRVADLYLKESTLGYEKLNNNAIETSAVSEATADSTLFKNNNSIVKIMHRDHGFEDGGNSYVFYDNSEDVGGISSSTLNSSLFKVTNSGIDTYNIQIPYRAGSSVLGGGENLIASHNRKYEKLYAQIPYLQANETNINSFVQTTNVVPVDSNTQNYKSYSTSNYEKTFLNEEHFFINQKVIVSDINKIINNIDNSLTYKIELSSNASYLSPVIDIASSSIKTSSSRVENAKGKEDRYGKRYQKLSFYPIYSFPITGNGDNDISLNQTIEGLTSKAKGRVVKYDSGTLFVKLTSINSFQNRETLEFSTDSQSGGSLEQETVSINGNISQQIPNFTVGETVTSISGSDSEVKYTNKISGEIVYWNFQYNELIVENNKQPINNNYTSKITIGSDYARSSTSIDQSSDIFRVGDFVYKNNLDALDSQFIEVSSMSFENGVDYISESESKNSSSVAKYVTKEISINDSATSMDVRLTVNVKDVENVKVFYKIKTSSSQENFEDIVWIPFNINGNPDTNEIASASNSISGEFENQESYQELKYSASNLTEFSSFGVKIVLKTDNPVYVPKIQDLRAVASY